jgi:2-iminoacetate synthase
MLMHIEYLENKYNVGPHTISVPRIEPAQGADLSYCVPHPVSDEQFRKLVAVLRLAVPYTGIILSTRESPGMRDELVRLGVSQISAASRTSPGGYDSDDNNASCGTQFSIGDQRSLDAVVGSLIRNGFLPSFCTACYRSQRTGEIFMNLARPGTIKEKCSVNALITLKEYLDDFASEDVRRDGYRLLQRAADSLPQEDRELLGRFFGEIDRGIRDRFV